MEYVLIAIGQFCAIFAKAFQQQNVTHERWWQIPPTSYVLYGFELFSWLFSVSVWLEHKSMAMVAVVWFCGATGAWLGTFAAMKAHRWLRKERNEQYQLGK